MLKLSIIIVNYNAKRFLRQCLTSLYTNESNLSFEAIVVDNNSHDGSVSMVRTDFPQTRLVENGGNVGFAKANNIGLEKARGKYTLLLNSDTKVVGDALEKMVLFLDNHPNVAVVTARLVYPDFSDQGVARTFPSPIHGLFGRRSLLTRLFPNNKYSQKYLVSHTHTTEKPFEVDWVSGACLMVRKEVLEEVGSLDERFWMYWEDADLCFRIKQKGLKVYCVPEAIVVHYEGKSVTKKTSNRCIIEFNKSAYRYYRKHHIRSSFEIMNFVAIIGLTLRTLALLTANALKVKNNRNEARKEGLVSIRRLNRKFFYLIIFIISTSFSYYPGSATAFGDNLVKNGDFEQKGKGGLPRGWQVVPSSVGKGNAIMDDKNVHSGQYSLRLKPNKKNTPEGFGVFMMLDSAAIHGKEVTIKGFAKIKGLGENTAAILLNTDRPNWVVIPKVAENKFVPFEKTFSISDSIPEAGLLLLVGGTKGNLWLDDLSIQVNQVSPPENLKVIEVIPTDSDTLKNKINTPGWQDSSFISPDGQELYFAYSPYAQKVFLDIIYGKISEKDVKIKGPNRQGMHSTMILETYKVVRNKDGTWGKPVNLNINSTFSLSGAKLSFDGTELYYSIRDYPENYGVTDIYVSKKLADGSWGPPLNLGTNINSKFLDDTPCLSADGKTLYFNRNKGDALGWEIMVSDRVKGKWTRAVKLGPPINEPNPETTANHQPFITADGRELYFTRIMNLYKSKRQLDGSWGKPVKVFNRVSGHASVTADGRYLYFLTAKDGESLKRHNWTIWYTEKQKDGAWGNPKPVD